MNWQDASMADAMKLVAERRLYAKEAGAIQEAQSARKELGILGASESQLNNALSALRRGQASASGASRKMHRAMPGAFEQIGNIPAATGTAISQGRPSDAMAQLDVLGLKNLSDPMTMGASALMAGGAAGLHAKVHDNVTSRRLLHGASEEARKAMKTELGSRAPVWEAWQADNKLPIGRPWERAYWQKPRLQAELKNMWHGPAANTPVFSMMPGKGKGAVPSLKHDVISKADLRGAAGNLPAMGRLAKYGPAVAAGLIPLLYREWMGKGYRSGHRPIQTLVQANQDLKNKQGKK